MHHIMARFYFIHPLVYLFAATCLLHETESIRCYQCSSTQNPDDDSCGAYMKFDKTRHIPIDCNSDESHAPGTFCKKITQQGPKGFISVNFGGKFGLECNGSSCVGDGRWRQVIRMCASVADTGVTGVCNWGVYENGIYWEECYCSEDGCNSSVNHHPKIIISILALFLLWLVI